MATGDGYRRVLRGKGVGDGYGRWWREGYCTHTLIMCVKKVVERGLLHAHMVWTPIFTMLYTGISLLYTHVSPSVY